MKTVWILEMRESHDDIGFFDNTFWGVFSNKELAIAEALKSVKDLSGKSWFVVYEDGIDNINLEDVHPGQLRWGFVSIDRNGNISEDIQPCVYPFLIEEENI